MGRPASGASSRIPKSSAIEPRNSGSKMPSVRLTNGCERLDWDNKRRKPSPQIGFDFKWRLLVLLAQRREFRAVIRPAPKWGSLEKVASSCPTRPKETALSKYPLIRTHPPSAHVLDSGSTCSVRDAVRFPGA